MSEAEPDRALWDALAEVHGRDAYDDTEGLVAGADTLSDQEDDAVRRAAGDVRGLDVLHVQCHIGCDTISLARRGARAVGVDFSPVALTKARDVAARTGVGATFVEGDPTALPAEPRGRLRPPT